MRRLLAVSATALLLAACGSGAPAPTTAPTSAPAPTVTAAPSPTAIPPSPTAAPAKPAAAPTTPAASKPAATAPAKSPASGPPAKPPSGAPSGPTASEARSVQQIQNLSSFRYALAMKIEGKNAGGQPVNVSFEMTGEETRRPRAAHWTLNMAGMPAVPAGAGALELYQIENDSYIRQGGTWIKSPVPATSMLEAQAMFSPTDFTSQLGAGQVVGTETVNGRTTTHYRYDKTALLASPQLTADDRRQFADLTQADFDIWLDNQDKFLVKFTMRTTGKQEVAEISEGTMTVSYDVKDVNSSFTITLPPAAANAASLPSVPGGLPGGLPAVPKP